MRSCVLACVCFLLAGAAAAQPVPAGTAAGSDGRTTASAAASADPSTLQTRPASAAIPSQEQRQDEYPADARRGEAAAAWTRLTRFLEAAGLFLVVATGLLFWWMRTPEDDLSAIRTVIGGDGPGALSIRRRGQMTHRPSGGACRTYNVVVPALDGGEHTLMVGVRRRMFGKGPVTLFDRNGHALRTLPRQRDDPAAITPHGHSSVAPIVSQTR